MDVQRGDFLCPAALPSREAWPVGLVPDQIAVPPLLAIRLVPKAASTSVLNWAAAMEGLWGIYADIVAQTAQRGLDFVGQLFQHGLDAAGCSPTDHESWFQRLSQFLPKFIGLPPQLCPSRCQGGGGRQ